MTAGMLSGFGPYRPGALSPVSLGMGDATVAAGAGTVAVISNPAGLSQVPQHTLEAGGTRNPAFGRSTLFVATADGSSPTGISAGMVYAWDSKAEIGGITRSGSDLRVAFGAGLGDETTKLYLGGSLRRLGLTYVDADDKKRSVNGWTGDVGAILALTQTLRLGVVYRNLVALDAVETPERIASGLAIAIGPVLASAEGSWGLDGGGTAWRAGAAVMIGDAAQLRAGWSQDGSPGRDGPLRRVHAGLGWRFGGVGFDLGAAIDIDRPSQILFAGALTFFLPYTMG